MSWLFKIGLSYHAIVADEDDSQGDGTIIKCVPDSKVAFHAGKSVGPDGPNANGYSLGLSFVNMETGKDPISPAQWDAAVQWCVAHCRAYPTIKWITTHAIVSPGRKFDPRGPLAGVPYAGFPLNAFCAEVTKHVGRPIRPWKP